MTHVIGRTTRLLFIGAALWAPRFATADRQGDLIKPETEPVIAPEIASDASKDDRPAESLLGARWFSAGVRFGIFPPVLTALDLTIRPQNHFAFSAYGIYLPNGVGLGNGGRRLMLAGNLTVEMAEARRSG